MPGRQECVVIRYSPMKRGFQTQPNRCRGALTKPFRNSKLHIRATMLLKIKGNLLEATMSLKTIRLN